MPVTGTTAQELFVGAGDLYMDGAPIGATQDNNVWRLVRTYFRPTLNGVRGPLRGTDYVQEEVAQLETTVPELSAANLAIAIPGTAATVTAVDGVLAGGGASTTLTGNTAAGADVIPVTATTNLAVDDVVQVGPSGATREIRRVTAINALNVTLNAPLTYAHSTGDVVQEIQATTLAADLPVGSTNAKVASVTGLAVGDYVLIGFPGERETRRLTFVGTTGAGGTGITWAQPTTTRHRVGDSVVETTGEGTTRITSTGARRIPDADYHDYELRVPGLGGREVRFGITDAIMTSNPEFTGADDGNMAPRLTLESRWDPSAPGTAPWYIDRVSPNP